MTIPLPFLRFAEEESHLFFVDYSFIFVASASKNINIFVTIV